MEAPLSACLPDGGAALTPVLLGAITGRTIQLDRRLLANSFSLTNQGRRFFLQRDRLHLKPPTPFNQLSDPSKPFLGPEKGLDDQIEVALVQLSIQVILEENQRTLCPRANNVDPW